MKKTSTGIQLISCLCLLNKTLQHVLIFATGMDMFMPSFLSNEIVFLFFYSKNFFLIFVVYRNKCFCTNFLLNNNISNACDYKCEGDTTQMCGSSSTANSVYALVPISKRTFNFKVLISSLEYNFKFSIFFSKKSFGI